MSGAPELLRRVARETTLFAGFQALATVLVAVSNLLLARVLDVRSFGIFAVCTLCIGVGSLLGDGGLGATLLRRRGEVSDQELRTVFTFVLGVGVALGAGLYLAAPTLARRYHLHGDELPALRASAVLLLAGPLRVVPYLRLERALQLSLVARIELLATLVRQGMAVLLALSGVGVWALLVAHALGAATQVGLAWWCAPGWTGFGGSFTVLKGLLSYGVRVQGLGVLAFLKDNISALFLGPLFGPEAVGLFDFGVKYAQIPVLAVNALGRVQLPVYARLDPHDPALHGALRGTTRMAFLVGLPVLVAMTVAAPAVVPWLYAPRWLESLPVIQGLALNMAGGLLAGPLFVFLQAQGHAGLALRVFLAWTAGTWALALALSGYGIGAVAWAQSACTVAVVLGLLRWAERWTGRSLSGALVVPLGAACAASAWGWLSRGLLGPLPSALGAVLVYLLVLLALERQALAEEARSLLSALTSRGHGQR
ncbi:MAG: oligosaccharide flippase family protein [Deltaproteobacteria bacterium]|nr:oligosaccharide flippase family protein [Deltaproteobacteria bacterium]